MKKGRKHLSKEMREVIEAGLAAGDSAGRIAKRINVSASTVTREVKTNRTVRERKTRGSAKLAVRCIHYNECEKRGGACPKCSTRAAACKHCRTRSCIDKCPDFNRKMCPNTQRWPYICPKGCPRRSCCSYPKCSYAAADAEASYRSRLSSSREGVAITEAELAEVDGIVAPLVRQGHSFAAIASSHDLPVCERTLYNYQEQNILSTSNIELPRKVRTRPRKKARGKARDRVDRTGRTFGDFKALPLEEQFLAIQADSVCGFERNEHDILSLHVVARKFQFYLHKTHADPASTVFWLDVMEGACGSRDAFGAAFPVFLCDRGVEFDDWEGMERSCLDAGRRRCRVFYCDPMESNQKSQAERNHEQLRRVLPKGRTDMDRLDVADVAVCCSHVNSYPLASQGGKCAFELAAGLFPQSLLDELGIARVAPDEVVLKPSLMAHAVEQ